MIDTWTAQSLGSLLGTRPWSGRVQSVHARAVNVLRRDGLVVSILAGVEAMTDLGVVVPALFASPRPDLQDRAVVARGGRIDIDGFGSIGLDDTPRWSGHVRSRAARDSDSITIFSILGDALARHGQPSGMLGLAIPSRESPWSAAARRGLEADPPNFAALVGLGLGMTPSGDDALTGILFAQRLGWGRLPPGSSPARLRRDVTAALSRTAPAGRTLLWLALRGRFAAPLVALAAASVPDSFSEAVRALCGLGETSGTDMLVGCWWACLPR
jgi:hypothetical protein